MPVVLRTEPLTREAFAPFGYVISAERGDVTGKPANQGTAKRFDWLGAVEDLRPGRSRLNLCMFRCSPRLVWPLRVEILERHPMTTQVIVPMTATRYVVLVGKRTEGGAPDLTTLRAFVARAHEGVAYHPGTWHHPLLALDRETDFTSLVWEDEGPRDCDLVTLAEDARPLVELVV